MYYSDEQWTAKEKWYKEKIGVIMIPKSVDSTVIYGLVSLIDEVMNSAFFDLSMAEYEYNTAYHAYQTRLSEAFLDAKNIEDKTSRGGTMSDEKAKRVAQVAVDKDGTLTDRLEKERRKEFMRNVVSLLQEKRSLLTISYGLSKMESGV